MKPKEFDDLVRSKFDQNDFAYKPGNWDALAEKLDGKEKKRSLMVWWWVPLAGMAASVVMAMGVTTMIQKQGSGTVPMHSGYAATHQSIHDASVGAMVAEPARTNSNTHKQIYAANAMPVKDNTDEWFAIKLQNVTSTGNNAGHTKNINLLAENEDQSAKKKEIKTLNQPIGTFKADDMLAKKEPKISLILSGGINRGNLNSGYMAGATLRRMVSDKVYVEGDLSFAVSSNTQDIQYLAPGPGVGSAKMSTPATAKHAGISAKTTTVENKGNSDNGYSAKPTDHDVSYNLYYAQITPSIGFKVMKRLSLGVGPDFQQMLVDNRPAPSTVDHSNLQEAPIFDVGFIGKTEYALTKKVKAAVYYRKGVNDIITPSDKYINRDYLQFQVKCVIFNK